MITKLKNQKVEIVGKTVALQTAEWTGTRTYTIILDEILKILETLEILAKALIVLEVTMTEIMIDIVIEMIVDTTDIMIRVLIQNNKFQKKSFNSNFRNFGLEKFIGCYSLP